MPEVTIALGIQVEPAASARRVDVAELPVIASTLAAGTSWVTTRLTRAVSKPSPR
jgi:hypothetical protein